MWPFSSPPGGRRRSRPRPVYRESFVTRSWRWARRLALLVFLGGVTAGGYLASVHLRRFVLESPYFHIDPSRVVILGASEQLERDALECLAEVLPTCDNNLIRLNDDRLAEQLAALPRARSARVTKVFPQGMRIELKEREPIMLVNLDRPYLMDEEGILLDEADPSRLRQLQLPVLTGVQGMAFRPGDRIEHPRLRDILDAVAFIRREDRDVYDCIAEWSLAGSDGITAILHTGVPVQFGSQPPLQLLDKFSAAIDRKPSLIEQAEYINLCVSGQVVYRLREGA